MVAVVIQVAGPGSFDAIQAESSRGVPLPPVEVSTLMRSSGDIKRRRSVIFLDTPRRRWSDPKFILTK
jgi:hypothetical protein